MPLKHQTVNLFPFQTKVIDEITGRPFRPHLHCPGCFGEAFKEVKGEKVCAVCNSPYPPVMLVCTPEICASS